ncbi:2-C-methyl-D-erythritol 2,4-cyclodiphosphate synthase [Rhodohalobacter mucosus]|uniref:2-C-methyl-D-erythritol 2,4-cyclodiphosphate synthase n=1 Tax=Rhodohalobacter mucosus TaxID=2079485 RepID=A0A316TPV2_9BACT|nr:2-C-methyl-D-erythritol 2,4-cyclodiphosphate synthase [Rhodohalobacter mucosus]PWN05229.1 2-C-methyl-D-erythritol 2,4-cyclodiphosphate synthase [Rhodohalobacter mucosus]
MDTFRIGFGYDVHRFTEGEALLMGGVKIPFHQKLEGHSDADVLLHAITDGLLGAAALGDIGSHFPDTDPAYKDADSRVLLRKSYQLVKEKGYELGNLDATIIAERPKFRPYIDSMRSSLAENLDCDADRVSIKATTNERMGFAGRQEGIAVHAVVLIKRINEA